MKKPIPRFKASVPCIITNDKITKRVSRAVWDALPKENRDCYQDRRYVKNAKGHEVLRGFNVYQKVEPVPPYPNPAIKALRAKLKRQRVKAVEWVEHRNGVAFLCFSTNPPTNQ
jgi:hypothetical protein